MASGTSDGSDFGGAGQSSDGPTRFRFQRLDSLHPEHNVALSVFPHGVAGAMQKQIEGMARRAGLEPQYVWADDPGGEQFSPRILSADPWNGQNLGVPEGSYAGATGNTTYGAVCWKKKRGHLEISYVVWSFLEAGDFSTSIVAKVVPPLYGTPQEIADLTKAAVQITTRLSAWLKAIPPSPAAIYLRKQISGLNVPR
jgi:hypothetical protein